MTHNLKILFCYICVAVAFVVLGVDIGGGNVIGVIVGGGVVGVG